MQFTPIGCSGDQKHVTAVINLHISASATYWYNKLLNAKVFANGPKFQVYRYIHYGNFVDVL